LGVVFVECAALQSSLIKQAGGDMYAVVKTGGKQYRVSAGEKLKIEQITAEVGQEIVLDQVLVVADGDALKMGTPLVAGAKVKAKVLKQGRHDKVHIFKMRRRKHYRKSQGHRQNYTEIEILGIAA
jgi:large subunit ribosomal protein L21